MANERLRAAIKAAGLQIDDIAAVAQVDAKTVRRWLGGRVPYARHRVKLAVALGREERELWPEADLRPSAGEDGREIIGAFAQANDLLAPDWRTMLKDAVEQVDLLDFTLVEVVQTAGVTGLLSAKASVGCKIRVLVSSAESAQLVVADAEQARGVSPTDVGETALAVDRARGFLEPLLDTPRIEVRTFVASRFNSILRFDDQMLVTLHLWGTSGSQAPLLHLRRHGDRGLFDQFADHYDAIWNESSEPVRPDPDYYPDPTEQPDRYSRPPE